MKTALGRLYSHQLFTLRGKGASSIPRKHSKGTKKSKPRSQKIPMRDLGLEKDLEVYEIIIDHLLKLSNSTGNRSVDNNRNDRNGVKHRRSP